MLPARHSRVGILKIMTCYNPKFAKYSYVKIIDEKTGEIKLTKDLKFLKNEEIKIDTPLRDKIVCIPCGKCEGCQIDKANDWATRAYLEAKNWPKNCFLTLTYNNETIAKNRSLVKSDLQKFWKRLRKEQTEPIRYLACGEYGPRTLRPHYHAAVFNYRPNDLKIYKKNITGDMLYTSERLNKIWGLGYVIIGDLTYQSAAYVARYVVKKAFGINKEWNLKHGRTPEFTLSSRKGGLGINALKKTEIWDKIKRNLGVLIKTREGNVSLKKIPEFLKRKWRESGENAREEYFRLYDERARELKNDTRARLEKGNNNYFQDSNNQKESKRLKFKRLDKRQDL